MMILTAPYLLAMGRAEEPVRNGAVAIRRGTICDVGAADSVIKRNPSLPAYSLHDCVLMPGLVNLHTHLELPPMLDKIRAKTFPDWILNLIAYKKKLSAVQYKRAVKINIKTIIETGTTTIGEICTHDTSPEYLKKSGLRAQVFMEIIGMTPLTARHGERVLSPKRSTMLIRYGLSPHSPYTVSEEVLQEISDHSRKNRLRIAMHIAESRDELKLLQRRKSGLQKIYAFAHWDLGSAPKGNSSFEYLNDIGLLSSRLLAVHAVQINDNDIYLIKNSGTAVAYCPRSNKELNIGKMPLRKFLSAGIPVGLGTDSLASVPTLSMWDEMRYAYQLHRRDGVTARDIFFMATSGGARALGLEREIGSLVPRKKADIIAVPLLKISTSDIYSTLLRDTMTCTMTMVNGHIINGRNALSPTLAPG